MFSAGLGSLWLELPGGLKEELTLVDATVEAAESSRPSSDVIIDLGVERPPSDLVAV